MILLSHPTGNTFVRALLEELERAGWDYTFLTTIAQAEPAWWRRRLPAKWQRELARRQFPVPAARCRQHPMREWGRLIATRLGCRGWVQSEASMFSVDAVYRDLDRHAAHWLRHGTRRAAVQAVHAYEDGALATFQVAQELGLTRSYELPIAYWETSRRLLAEEVERWPAWGATLRGLNDSGAKRERKQRELELADVVVCPSDFVYRSLPEAVRQQKNCVVAPFGSPLPVSAAAEPDRGAGPLRVLFAGSMTQRKGLADVFAALKLLRRQDVELVVMGAPVAPMRFYRNQFADFRHAAPRSHAEVMALMRRCDVLVLPSIVEGRALVQQEALSCGLPLIVTPNAGGEDLIEPGRTGFLVPIRSPEAIAQRIAWFADRRARLPELRRCAQAKAAQYTWADYARGILRGLENTRDSSTRTKDETSRCQFADAVNR